MNKFTKNDLKIVRLDENYCNYLRKFDFRVPYNKGDKILRPFIGVLFSVENFKYFAPLSSPKKKHLKISNKLDFYKLDNGKLGAINFNNMLPVYDNNVVIFDLTKNVCNDKYNYLLYKQYRWLNRNKEIIFKNSYELYKKYISGKLPASVKERCCNFPLLEKKCREYNKITV